LQSEFFRELDEASAPLFDGPEIFDPEIFDTITKGIVVSDQLSRIAGNPRLITDPPNNVASSKPMPYAYVTSLIFPAYSQLPIKSKIDASGNMFWYSMV